MRSLLFVSLFLVSIALLTAQAQPPRTFVSITDFGQLYSTYNWDEANVELTERLGKKLADEVMAGSVESAWPEGIGDVLTRNENRSLMGLYKVYYVTTLKNNVAILGASPDENGHMPANMKLKKDLYFVVGISGVDLSNVNTTSTPAKSTVVAGNFAAQLNTITEDFGTGFASSTGAILEEDEDALTLVYGTLKVLDGATDVYFLEDLYSATTMFHADFPVSTNFEVALKNYNTLVQQVEATKPTCCEMKKEEEYVDGKNRRRTFTVVKSGFAFANMVIDVHLEQGESFDKDGQLVADWRPVLEIYEK